MIDEFQVEKYTPSLGSFPAIICDLDGTLALHQGRDPYDTARCEEDAANRHVVEMVRSQRWRENRAVLLVSGRYEKFRPHTVEWLRRNRIPFDLLLMRPDGDRRRDDIVKLGLFNEYIRDSYNVDLVLDDRDRVVKMWRSLGIETWQVAEGHF